ncbi:uncharacterized protein LOC117604520 [Osmia lignaria lignaria]|uniref:uncharacterized protein LOC117604520 n=1 Tax=Osmia lignaria lignaria TaxID=1437193 RepID=UPI00402B0C82
MNFKKNAGKLLITNSGKLSKSEKWQPFWIPASSSKRMKFQLRVLRVKKWQKYENKVLSVLKTLVIVKSLCAMDTLISCLIRYQRRNYCDHEPSSPFHRSRSKTTRSNWWLIEDNEM